MVIKKEKIELSDQAKKDMLDLISNTKEKGLFFHSKFKEHTSTAIIAAFSFLIALAWRDLVVKLVENYIKPSTLLTHPYLSELISALIVTIFSVIAIIFVSKWAGKEK